MDRRRLNVRENQNVFVLAFLFVCGTFCNNFPVVSQGMNRYSQVDSCYRMTFNRLNAKSNISRFRTIRFICFIYLLFSVSAKEPHFLSSCVSYGFFFFYFSVTCILYFRENREAREVFYLLNPVCV